VKQLASLPFTQAVSSSMSKPSLDPNDLLCEICEERDALSHCQQCSQYFCGECERLHKKAKTSQTHVLVPLEEMDFRDSLLPRLQSCSQHPNQEIDTFCHQEQVSLCPKCAVEKHGNHNVVPLSLVVEQTKKEILGKLQRVFLSFFPSIHPSIHPSSFAL